MKDYFKKLDEDSKKIYQVAEQARKKGLDPTAQVEITLAKNMAERVIGMISVVTPEIKNSKAAERIIELEKEFGILDWKVALLIAKEVAQEKFCKFKSKKDAIETGIRTGFAYVTVGVVSSPLEGFTSLEIKKRRDNKGEYFCLNYAGPIRNAGGTAAAVSALIADYIRKELGYSEYDPTEDEIKRCYTEITDYHERVTNLQYFPSQKETEFLLRHLPVEISGDESEKFEVSNYKDLPRIRQNRLRSGYCLMHSSCIPLKAPKLWKQISSWGEEFKMNHWNFLKEFIRLQEESQSKGEETKEKIGPNHTYIKDLVAGRPVISYPMRQGGFRLRYGRGRFSGFSAQSIHPATMHVLGNFVATATQLKVERPGKAAAITVCDSVDGPIVKLKNGSIKFLETEKLAKEYKKEIKEILFLGDILVNYGDFLNRAHSLVPPGYCQEWWILDFEQKAIELFGNLDYEKIAEIVNIDEDSLKTLFKKPLKTKLSPKAALRISSTMNIPLHPKYTSYWTLINLTELKSLISWLIKGKQEDGKIILNKSEEKQILEKIGLPHNLINQEKVVIEKNQALTVLATLGCLEFEDLETTLNSIKKEQEDNILKIINKISLIPIKDKAGIFIGSRMGRPEKSKMRKMTGSPHTLFPVGEAGGRLRSFQSALEKGKIKSAFSIFDCKKCDEQTVYSSCPNCQNKTERIYFCSSCGEVKEKDCKIHGKTMPYKITEVDIKKHFAQVLKLINEKVYPDLIKGVRGTSNEEHIPEHLSKGILRAKHNIYVNKDGTTRYDCSEVPITHFKPKEIFVNIEKLKKLGYEKDIKGKELINENQVLELKPQDIILPCPTNTIDEPADDVLFRTTKFLDELLVKTYNMKPYYNLRNKEDLVGHYVIGLAPHTSAGTLARIIGFSRTQGLFTHPLLHAAMRRDCDGDESCVLLLLDAFMNFSQKYLPKTRGSTMDAPIILTSILNPTEVDDMIFDMDIAKSYPLQFYKACQEYKMPWEVKIEKVGDYLGTEKQYQNYGYTHSTNDINEGVLCSVYKTLPTMEEKLKGQMELAEKIKAVDKVGVAKLVIEKHFLKDIRGNLRKFSQQQFRCVNCNEKFRRPPLSGICTNCQGKIIFTISEGSVIKYLEPSLSLANKYELDEYMMQTLELTKNMVEEVFGKDKEKQAGLGDWFS